MAVKKTPRIRILKVKKGDTLAQIYKKAHKAFTAADLQRYTQDEPMIPAEQLLEELRAIDREYKRSPGVPKKSKK